VHSGAHIHRYDRRYIVSYPKKGMAMMTVTMWTGFEANVLRNALRMSVTDFAEHLGAGRRTVAKWSSRGRDIQLSVVMQAALDTVLTQASPEVRERFDQLRTAGTGDAPTVHTVATTVQAAEPMVDTDPSRFGGLDRDGDMRRRDLLVGSTLGGAAALPAINQLLDTLVSTGHSAAAPIAMPSLRHLAEGVATAKADYQACRYELVLERLVTLLPALSAAEEASASDERARLNMLATDLYHVVGSVLLKCGDQAMALVAAERSTRCGLASGDPVAVGTSARIMTHALMSNGHTRRALALAQAAADGLDQATGLNSTDAVAVYGAILLRGAIAAARANDRDAAHAMLDEASRAANRLGHDGNDRWTGFGPSNVLLHRVNTALTLGDAGTAIAFAQQVDLDKIRLAERKASLFVDVAQAFTQWGRHEQGLSALRNAYRIAPDEIRFRPAVQRIVGDLAVLARGQVRTKVADFAATAGVRL
jgi:tetratricopeptide (TPR) repeat protein